MSDTAQEPTGFSVPDVWTWASFVATGELARTLTRMCWLVRARVELGYRLVRHPEHVVLTVIIDDAARDTAIARPTGEHEIDEPLDRVIAAVNDALAAAGHPQRFAMVVRSAPLHQRRRIALADDRETLAPIDERIATRLDIDGSLLGLVTAYIERLAAFAGIENMTCTPRWAQDPGVLAITVEQRLANGVSSSSTLELRYMPELEVQPILDKLNSSIPGRAKRLYRIARGPDRVDVALLDKAEAAAARRTGDLIEQPARDEIRALAAAGFELESLYGEWRWNVRKLDVWAARLQILAGVTIACDVEVGTDAATVAWAVGAHRSTTRYAGDDLARPTVEMLGVAVGQLNRLLVAAGHADRCVVLTGRPHFWNHRMMMLDPEWLARIAHTCEVLPGCLDGEVIAPVIGIYPHADPEVAPAQLPLIQDIVDRGDILDHDFKCSARPWDMADLIEEIATFARLAVEVDRTIVEPAFDDDDGNREQLAFRVTYRGETTRVVLDNAKYVDVSPVLRYVNAILDGHRPRRQLHRFRAGGWSGGLLRATDDEATRLREVGYIS